MEGTHSQTAGSRDTYADSSARTDGPKKSARIVATNPLTWASSGPARDHVPEGMRAHQVWPRELPDIPTLGLATSEFPTDAPTTYQGMVHWWKGTRIDGRPVGKYSELQRVFFRKGHTGCCCWCCFSCFLSSSSSSASASFSSPFKKLSSQRLSYRLFSHCWLVDPGSCVYQDNN